MKKRNLGNTDIKLTSIGFGGAPLGNLFEELNETHCFDIVKSCFENNIKVINILTKNCLGICKNNQFKIYEEDLIHSKLEIEFKNISVVYIDPPYAKYNLTNLLENLSSKIKNTTVIGLETGVKDNIVIPENLNLLQKKTYGKTIIYIFKLS